jgi:hypothetical protein
LTTQGEGARRVASDDATHWLRQYAPREWIRAALNELDRARSAFEARDRKGALATCRRAAGMAINGALCVDSTELVRYGRSYMDHLVALASDERAPEAVRGAARALIEQPPPGSGIVLLRTHSADQRLLEATQDVMAHALAVVLRAETDGDA